MMQIMKQEALDALKNNWGVAVLVWFILAIGYVLVFIIFFSINLFIPFLFDIPVKETSNLPLTTVLSFAGGVVSLLLIPLYISITWFFLDIARRNSPRISEVFKPYNNIIFLLKMIKLAIAQIVLIILWSFLFVIPGIMKGISYSQAFYLLKDHPEYTIFEALAESRRRMHGYKWRYFMLNLSFIGWGIVVSFTLGIGSLWLSPYLFTTQGVFYDKNIALEKGN
ncbi:DUF975 family protein [Niallia taxi]|uniref:DUF975 family protein n=1 Tax=Niallia taxi TaxID=2499688 RepID=UPI002E23BC55|nr:DUF975 family protein [Niallia taxi]